MIKVKDLSMYYGSTVAVDRVSFHISKGEIVGLLGPNGAGKTTTMRILTTYIIPTSGEVAIGGHDLLTSHIPIRKMIGYLPETPPLYMDMLVCDYLSFIADARGLTNDMKKKRIGWITEACKIKDVYKKGIIELSRGYRQRVGLAQALIHDPEILILDEPTSGLDPLQIIDIRNLIKGLARKKTIIFSTHILQEVTAISDRVIIINEGRIIADGPKEMLEMKAMKTNRSILVVKAERDDVAKGLDEIKDITGYSFIETIDGSLVKFEVRSEFRKDIWEEIDNLIKRKGWKLRSFHDQPITFEDTFISLIKESKNRGERHNEEF
ncbi:MAG: ATP-binding cassette domain-containing protein [Nitrospirota bacterium]